MQPLPPWDELKRGLGCPICTGNRKTDFHWFVRTLRLSSLYLTRGQTYRGSSVLIVDGRHVNYISELTPDEWSLVAQDLRDAERSVLCVFAPDHMNIECLGNTVPHLHWGLWPRYKNDGRWGQSIWRTTRSEMRQDFLTDSECTSYVRQLQQALDVR
jgi:diadenosine tetraphosphate (Ap4A) HIT family hydrolase